MKRRAILPRLSVRCLADRRGNCKRPVRLLPIENNGEDATRGILFVPSLHSMGCQPHFSAAIFRFLAIPGDLSAMPRFQEMGGIQISQRRTSQPTWTSLGRVKRRQGLESEWHDRTTRHSVPCLEVYSTVITLKRNVTLGASRVPGRLIGKYLRSPRIPNHCKIPQAVGKIPVTQVAQVTASQPGVPVSSGRLLAFCCIWPFLETEIKCPKFNHRIGFRLDRQRIN